MKLTNKIALALAFSAAACVQANATSSFAFATTSNLNGNQTGNPNNLPSASTSPQLFGFTFSVDSLYFPNGVAINKFGVFDSGRDGFTSTLITASLYDMSSGSTLISPNVSFSGNTAGSAGAFDNGDSMRYKTVATINLLPDTIYEYVVSGLGTTADPYYKNPASSGSPMFFDTALGVNFDAWYNNANSILLPAPPNLVVKNPSTHVNYGAEKFGVGSVGFTDVPEMDSFAIAGVGMLGLIFVGRRLIVAKAA